MNLDVVREAFLHELEEIGRQPHEKVGSHPLASRIRGIAGAVHASSSQKSAGVLGRLAGEAASHKADLAGLGMLAGISADRLQAGARAKPGEDWQSKSLLGGETGHHIADIAGLGVLGLPSAAHLAKGRLPIPKVAHPSSRR